MKIVVSETYQHMRGWLETIPTIFHHTGEIIYNARNQIRVIQAPDGTLLNVKRYHQPSMFNRIVYSTLRPSKAYRAYSNAMLLQQKNIPTPTAVAYILCGTKLLKESYLITLQESLTHTFYEFRYHSVKGYESVIRDFAIQSANMHAQGVLHKDFSPGNILFDYNPDGSVRFSFVDINRMYIGKEVGMKESCKNFCRLWGHADFIELLSMEYAKARGWDKKTVYQLINHYWRRFWHIKTDADIDLVFDNTPRASVKASGLRHKK